MTVQLPPWSYAKAGQRARFYGEALNGSTTLPGVESAAFASSPPLRGGRFGANTLTIEGRSEPPATALRDVAGVSITPGYFQAMHTLLQAGRLFDDRDTEGSEAVAIVNEALVRKYFPDGNAIGMHIRGGEPANDKTWLTIVGIAGNEKDRNFFQEMNWEEMPLVFRPMAQQPSQSATLVIRTAQDQTQTGGAIQKEIWSLDRHVPAGEAQTMDQQLSRVLAYPRFRAVVLGTFAGLALLLTGVGLYGVLAQSPLSGSRNSACVWLWEQAGLMSSTS